MRMKSVKTGLCLVAMLGMLLGGLEKSAFAITINMRPAAGQSAPGTVTQTDGSVVTPDANGNFPMTQVLSIGNQIAQGWVFSVPATSVNILGNVSAGTVNLDLSKGCMITETLTGNITHTFSNAAYCKGETICVNAGQDGTGGRSITWVGFSGLTPPQPNQAVSGQDMICFADNGTQVVYPTSGQNQTFGSVVLNGSSAGSATITVPATVSPSYTETLPSAVPAQGDLLTFSNGTGQQASVVDVAVGRVLISGGVGAVPTYSATPTLGVGGTTAGTLTLSAATGAGTYTLAQANSTTTYTETTKALVPAQGDILDYTNGTGQRGSIVDVATGSVLVSGGIATAPAYSATPSLTSMTLAGTGDHILQLTNGGHLSSLKGSASLPTVGTGTVTAGGTDNAFEITGATSPVTATFATAFANTPICVCSDETAALGACKAVPSSGAAVVLTTTGTDSVQVVCVGK